MLGVCVDEALIRRNAVLSLSDAVDDDKKAVDLWLRATANKSRHTREAYSREAGRFCAWLLEQDLTLQTCNVSHINDYFETLSVTLSDNSINYVRSILVNLYDYLVKITYCNINIPDLTGRRTELKRASENKGLSKSAMQCLLNQMKARVSGDRMGVNQADRDYMIVLFLYHTGLRREEAVKATMGDFVCRDGFWQLRVVGKRNKERFISLNVVFMRHLREYRKKIGLSEYPFPAETLPVISHAGNRERPLSIRGLGYIIKSIGQSIVLPESQSRELLEIRAMSVHTMRHTFGTHRLSAGALLETTQDEMGHSDMNTTRIYAKNSNQQRQKDADIFSQFLKSE